MEAMKHRRAAVRKEVVSWLPTQGLRVRSESSPLVDLLTECVLHFQGDIDEVADVIGVTRGGLDVVKGRAAIG